MYVCLCQGVTDREIHRAVDEGACTVAEVARCTGAGTCCGKCRPAIAVEIEKRLASSERHLPVFAASAA